MTDYLRRLFRSALGRVWPGRPLSEAPGVLWSGRGSASGVDVTVDTALSLSAVFAAVQLLTRVFGSLPRQVYQREGRRREQAVTHPAYRLLHTSPNPEMTSATFHRVLEWNRLLYGNAYAEIAWYGNMKPAALWPIEAWRVKPKRREDGALYYQVDGDRDVEPEDMLHVPLVSSDGVTGRGFMDWASESLGLGIATQTHAGSWFGNGARPGVILKNPREQSPEAAAKFREQWNKRHQGSGKSGGTAVMYGGWEWVGTDGQVDPEKSQLLQQRQFTVTEVARWFGIPPHLLADLVRATFSNIEQQNLDFLVYCFTPILTDYEQEYDRKLLSPPNTYMKHNVAALLRGDMAARSAFYTALFNIGVLSDNDIRDLEDWNPIEGGDTYFVPLNMVPLAQAARPPEPTPAPTPAPAPAAPTPAPDSSPQPALRLLASTLERLAKVEANELRRAAKKPGRFLAWAEEFYPAQKQRLTEALAAVLPDCAGRTWPGTAEELAEGWCAQSASQVLALADAHTAATIAAGAEGLLSSWKDRPETQARMVMGVYSCRES